MFGFFQVIKVGDELRTIAVKDSSTIFRQLGKNEQFSFKKPMRLQSMLEKWK